MPMPAKIPKFRMIRMVAVAREKLADGLSAHLEGLLDRALAGRADQGRVVFFRKVRRHLDGNPDGSQASALLVPLPALGDADAVRWDLSFLAEAQHVDPGAGGE